MGTTTTFAAEMHPVLAAAKTTSNPAYTFLILAVLIGLFYVLIMRPQRNRQRKLAEAQKEVVPGQRIRTTAGMYGTVVSGNDRDVVIEIAPGVHVTMLRRAVMEVVPDDQPMPETIDNPGDEGSTSSDDWDFNDGTSTDDMDSRDHNA